MSEEQQSQNDRQYAQRVFNNLISNVTTNSNITTGDLSANLGETPQDDLTSIITRDMQIFDFMNLMKGQRNVLDKYHEKIKFRFQNF